MNELSVRVRRETRPDGAKTLWIEFHNDTDGVLTNVPCGVKIADKKGFVYKDINETIESVSPGDYGVIEIDERDFVEPFATYYITVTANETAWQYAISLYYLDGVENGKIKKPFPISRSFSGVTPFFRAPCYSSLPRSSCSCRFDRLIPRRPETTSSTSPS